MNEAMQDFTEQIGFIIFFLVTTLLVSMVANEKILHAYLLLIFAGEVIFNAQKIKTLYGKVI